VSVKLAATIVSIAQAKGAAAVAAVARAEDVAAAGAQYIVLLPFEIAPSFSAHRLQKRGGRNSSCSKLSSIAMAVEFACHDAVINLHVSAPNSLAIQCIRVAMRK
jgi:hypothetical protein